MRCILGILMIFTWFLRLDAAELPFVQQDGYRFATASLALNGASFRVWIYAPDQAAAGANGTRACILVPAAGSPLIYGMNLRDGDRPEHLPYVRQGQWVVAFDLIGGVAKGMSAAEMVAARTRFFQAGMGLDQIPVILAFIAGHLPEVDATAIYLAGHSSAATFALQASQSQAGLAGVMAFCPVVDIEARIAKDTQAAIRATVPRFAAGLAAVNPVLGAAHTRCKVLLYGSRDDANARLDDIEVYATRMDAAGMPLTFIRGSGSHYDAMIAQGIPAAISWLAH